MVTTTWDQKAGMTSPTDTDNLESYAEQAEASKDAAAASEAAAAASAAAAAASEVEAESAEANAATSATTATTGAATATTKASEAATGATSASTSAAAAQTAQTAAEAAATAAAASEAGVDADRVAAEAAATAAAASETATSTSATNAATSATASASSAAAATASASAASAVLSGALLATNNLSDVSDATTARTNLGLGTAATTAATDYATAAHSAQTDNPHSVTAAQVLAAGNMFLDKSGLSFAGFMECDGSEYDAVAYPNLAALGYSSTSAAYLIDLGTDGKLILPATVGSDVFYYWDFDGSGAPSDTATLSSLKSRFNGGSNFTGTEPQITLSGVGIALPAIGITTPVNGGALSDNGNYTGLAAIWDYFNGAPTGWPTSFYCSSSPFNTTGAWRLSYGTSVTSGTTSGSQNSHVAVRIPNPPQVTTYAVPDSANLGAPAGYSYYIKY